MKKNIFWIPIIIIGILFVAPHSTQSQTLPQLPTVSINSIVQENSNTYTIEATITPVAGHTVGDPITNNFYFEWEEPAPQTTVPNQSGPYQVTYNPLNETYYLIGMISGAPAGTSYEFSVTDGQGGAEYVPPQPLIPSKDTLVITYLPSASNVTATTVTIAGAGEYADPSEPVDNLTGESVRIAWWKIGDTNINISSAIPLTYNPTSDRYEFTYTQDKLTPQTSYAVEIRNGVTQEMLVPPQEITTGVQTGTGGSGGSGSSGGTSGSGIAITSMQDIIDAFSIDSQRPDCVEGQGEYCLIEPLPGITKISQGTTFGDYLNLIIKIVIGLIGVISVIMLIVAGIQYMTTEAIYSKGEAKKRIAGAIGGLILALGSYLILNTLNPNLIVLEPQVESQTFAGEAYLGEAYSFLSDEDFSDITGLPLLTPIEYEKMGYEAADKVGIPRCVMRTILDRESKGDPRAIGIDENVTRIETRSRKLFLNTGHYYYAPSTGSSGTGTFTPTKDYYANIYNKQNANHNAPQEKWPYDPKKPGLGLDWRFSKGIGLTQFTFFPAGYWDSGYAPQLNAKDTHPEENIGGQTYTPRDLINPETNLEAGGARWKIFYDHCAASGKINPNNNNLIYGNELGSNNPQKREWPKIEAGFYGYANGFNHCNGEGLADGVKEEVGERMKLFIACQQQGLDQI